MLTPSCSWDFLCMFRSVTCWLVVDVPRQHSAFTFKDRSVREECMHFYALEDITSLLSRNVGHQSPSYAALHARRMESSTVPLRKLKLPWRGYCDVTLCPITRVSHVFSLRKTTFRCARRLGTYWISSRGNKTIIIPTVTYGVLKDGEGKLRIETSGGE
jgi:hypothetical protein